MLAGELAVIVQILSDVFAGEQGVQFLQPGGQLRQLGGDRRFHSGGSTWYRRASAATRESRSLASAELSACVGACRNLLVSAWESCSSTFCGSSPLASSFAARSNSWRRIRSA